MALASYVTMAVCGGTILIATVLYIVREKCNADPYEELVTDEAIDEQRGDIHNRAENSRGETHEVPIS